MISLRNVITFPSVLTEINFYFNETTGQNAIMNKNHLVQHLEGMEHPPTLVNKKVTTFKKKYLLRKPHGNSSIRFDFL